MPPRNHKNWLAKPKVESISSECYNNQEIFEQEIKHIFSKVWVPVCHTSEMDMTGCYRTTQIAFQNVIVIITLGIFSGKCIERLQNCNIISKVIVSDTICQKKNLQNLNKLEIFSISELMSEVITNIIIGGSLSLLFES